MVAAVPYLMLAASTVSAAGSVVGGIQQQKADSYNAEVATNQANTDIATSQAQAQQIQQQNQQRIGQEVANAGASGVDPSQGSPLAVMSNTATEGELNRQLTLWQGSAAATSLRNQASSDTYQGNQALIGGIVSAGGTLLSAGANFIYNLGPATGSTGGTGGGGLLRGPTTIATPRF